MGHYYDSRPCGAGKTYQTITDIIDNTGLYLMAIERRERLRDVERDIQQQARARGVYLTTRVIHASDTKSGIFDDEGRARSSGSTTVRLDIEALPHEYADDDHRVVLITHEALRMCDLRHFEGWNLIIDEAPGIWDTGTLKVETDTSRNHLATYYDLVPIERADGGRPTRSRIVPRSCVDQVELTALTRDSAMSAFADLHARVMSPVRDGDPACAGVTTELMSWSDLVDAKSMSWSSIWSPRAVEAFENVTILANNFPASVTYGLFRSMWPDIVWTDLGRETGRRFARRTVRIHYYTHGHEARRNHFGKIEGKRCLHAMARDIAKRVGDEGHIWTCREIDMPAVRDQFGDFIIPGAYLSPKQAGSNRHAGIHSASMLYTAKPTKHDIALMHDLCIDPDMITETRERETLVQFATRTSVRDAGSSETVSLYVYDIDQADHLADYFTATGFCDVEIVPVDAGFLDMTVEKKKAGRPKVHMTREAKLAAEVKRKREARAKAKAKAEKAKALTPDD